MRTSVFACFVRSISSAVTTVSVCAPAEPKYTSASCKTCHFLYYSRKSASILIEFIFINSRSLFHFSRNTVPYNGEQGVCFSKILFFSK